MAPEIDGEVHRFEYRGLYDGVSLLWDYDTGTYWHHITGEALTGPLEGRVLAIENILHTTVGQMMKLDPALEIAVSDRPIRREPSRMSPVVSRLPGLSDRLRSTMAGEDTRRPTMEVGLGVWTDDVQRFYPMDAVRAKEGDLLFDEFAGRRMLVYFEPVAHALYAIRTDAQRAWWEDEQLHLDTGQVIRGSALFEGDELVHVERPLQVFTRWYGYALTFPKTEIYQP